MQLPNEINLIITGFLDYPDMMRLGCTCWYWHNMIKNNERVVTTAKQRWILDGTPPRQYLKKVKQLIIKKKYDLAAFLLETVKPETINQLTEIHIVTRALHEMYVRYVEKDYQNKLISFVLNRDLPDPNSQTMAYRQIKRCCCAIIDKYQLTPEKIKSILSKNALFFGVSDINSWKFLLYLSHCC